MFSGNSKYYDVLHRGRNRFGVRALSGGLSFDRITGGSSRRSAGNPLVTSENPRLPDYYAFSPTANSATLKETPLPLSRSTHPDSSRGTAGDSAPRGRRSHGIPAFTAAVGLYRSAFSRPERRFDGSRTQS